MRIMLILVSILAACTFPPFNKTPESAVVPEVSGPEPLVIEIPAPRRETRTRRATPKPVPAIQTPEEELINPIAECAYIGLTDPKEAARAKLDCMKERLQIKDEE